jgi:hypothetical protein
MTSKLETVDDPVLAGNAALARSEWSEARQCFESALAGAESVEAWDIYTARAHNEGMVDQIIEEVLAFPHKQSTEDLQAVLDAFLDHDTTGRLPEIATPTLVLAGGRDSTSRPELLPRRCRPDPRRPLRADAGGVASALPGGPGRVERSRRRLLARGRGTELMVRKSLQLTLALAVAFAAPAAAHEGAAQAGLTEGTPVKLRDCHLTATFAPRPALALEFGAPFYGPDPLVGVWAMACDRSRVAGEPAGPLVLSMVGVPVGLTAPGALPLANNFAHRLLQLDTTSRRLAKAARRSGLPATIALASRYRHSPPGEVPSRGSLVVPGSHTMAVVASQPDPTNPHDHANLFEHRDGAALGLTIEAAFDRFCLSPGEGCSASLRTARGSALNRLLGQSRVPVRAAFDHDRLRRVDIVLRASR